MKQNKSKGITLISLVITIIVLLILAGVTIAMLTGDNGIIGKAGEAKFKTELSAVAEEYDLYVIERTSKDRNFEEGALYAGKNALIYDSITEEGNIYTVLKNSDKKYVDNFEVIKGELFYFTQNEQEKKWAQEIGIKVSPYIIIDGELMSSNTNLDLMDKVTGTIVIPQNVTKIGNGAFRDVTGLRSIVIPGTVKEIGEYAFSGNPTLENVVIEEGVEKIGAFAFQACTALKSIKIADSVSEIGSTCFGNCTALAEINFPKALKTIPYRMLSNCTSLTEIEIPEGIERIDTFAFEVCSNLTRVKIPSTVTSISGSAFQFTGKLTNIEISEANNTYTFSNSSLMSKDGKKLYYVISNTAEINIPETVERIEWGALSAYSQKAVLNISKNVKTIDTVFETNTITQINVVEENQYFKSLDGNLYTKDMTTLIRYTQNESSFTIPDTVKIIKNNAMCAQNNLSQLILPENLESIGTFIINYTKITQLDLGENVNNLNSASFSGRNVNLTISKNNPNFKTEDGTIILSKDGKKLLAVSKDLTTYEIPSSVENIGPSAFYSKNNLKEINLPANIKNIESGAFDYSINFQKVTIQSNIENIATDAFSRCNSLKEIIIDKKEGEISGAPWGCPYGLRAVFWKK